MDDMMDPGEIEARRRRDVAKLKIRIEEMLTIGNEAFNLCHYILESYPGQTESFDMIYHDLKYIMAHLEHDRKIIEENMH